MPMTILEGPCMVSQTTGTEVGPPNLPPHIRKKDINILSTNFGFLPIPKRLRFNPDKPFHFGIVLNVSFGFASTFTMANLFYCQPLLIEFSKSFDVDYNTISLVPTLMQAGYATGLLLILPLADLVRRRQLVLLMALMSTTLTIGLSMTFNLHVFEVLCFLIGTTSVSPQILILLAADLAPSERRSSALSVVFSGLLLGILGARLLAGIIGNFGTWRMVYYMAIGVQFLVLFGAYFVLPDYPPQNRNLTYFNILYTMAKYAVTESLLIQTSLINFLSSACFTSFWITLTFLLGGPPYYYSTLHIGLFGLAGMLGVIISLLTGRLVDIFVPWYATLVATSLLLLSQAVQTAAGGVSVSAVIIACIGLDAARQIQQVSLGTSVLSISASARARMNAVFMLSLFVGQVMGTSVGTRVFVQHGWRACALLALALYSFQIGIHMLRGPHCPRNHWFGWAGGFEPRRRVMEVRDKDDALEAAIPTDGSQGMKE